MIRSWVIYGAYGHSGALITERACAHGMRPLLAGRDAKRLAAVAQRYSLDSVRCSLDDPSRLDDLLGGATVLLNCAGPFVKSAETIAASCIRSGTHYLDISGEPQVFALLAQYNEAAQRAGVMLLPGVGLDIVLSDYLAHYLKKRLPTATRLVVGFRGVERASRGAINTLVDTMLDPWPPLGDRQPLHAAAGPRTAKIDFGDGPESAVSVPWADVISTQFSTGIREVLVYLSLPFRVRLVLNGIRALPSLARRRPVRLFLTKQLSTNRAWGVPGPVAEPGRRIAMYGEASNRNGRAVRAIVRGPDSHTVLTGVALAAVRYVLEGKWASGFRTPTRVYGCELVDALSDVEFEDIDTE